MARIRHQERLNRFVKNHVRRGAELMWRDAICSATVVAAAAGESDPTIANKSQTTRAQVPAARKVATIDREHKLARAPSCNALLGEDMAATPALRLSVT